MNSEASWVFYRYAVGFGTAFLGLAGVVAAVALWRIQGTLEKLRLMTDDHLAVVAAIIKRTFQ